MADRPIMFSGMMVRSIQAEPPKEKTRRLAKARRRASILATEENADGLIMAWTDGYILDPGNAEWLMQDAPCAAGDTLWVRENFRLPAQFNSNTPINVKENVKIHYEADGAPSTVGAPFGKLRPSIHMPRFRSRLTLDCLSVRCERLNDCTEEEAIAEGIWMQNVIVGAHCYGGRHFEETADRFFYPDCREDGFESALKAYVALWEHLHGAGSWALDPLVWVIGFRRTRQS